MPKPFADIQTDAEYLRAVGMYMDTHSEIWAVTYNGYFALHDTDPARKWRNLGNALEVLGPEMDRRGWKSIIKWDASEIHCWTTFKQLAHVRGDLPHLALLEAFYRAHAQGDTA